MPVGTPVLIGSGNWSSGSSFTVTTTLAASIGDVVYVAVWVPDALTSSSLSTVSDGVGNIYSIDTSRREFTDGYLYLAIASAKPATATVAIGTIVTINLSSTPQGSVPFAAVVRCPGVDRLDKTSGNSGIGTSWSTGSSGVLSQADELAMAFDAHPGAGTASTPNAGWTELIDAGSSFYRRVLQYQITASTAAVNAGGTKGFGSWNAVLTTYMQGSAPSSGNKSQMVV